MLAHKIGPWGTDDSSDLSKRLFDQIGACSMVLWVPDGPGIVGILIIVGLLDLLLDLQLFERLEVDEAGHDLFTTALLVLSCKTRAHDNLLQVEGNINTGVTSPSFHPTGLADCRHKLLHTLLIMVAKGMGGIITLLIYDGINELISKA